jgi:hypothetical protein
MTTTPKSLKPVLVLGGACCALVLALSCSNLSQTTGGRPATVARAAATAPAEPPRPDVELRQALDSLAVAAASIRRPVGDSAADAVTADETSQVLQALASLQRSVESLQASLADTRWHERPPTLAEVRAGKQVTDREAIAAVADRFRADAEGVTSQLRFRTYAEVLGEFGPPSRMAHDGCWWYRRADESDPGPRVFKLTFRGGYVTEALVIDR